MALDKARLKAGIITQMNAFGFDTGNQFAITNQLAEAIANAVVDEFIVNAEVTGGTSSMGGSITGAKVI